MFGQLELFCLPFRFRMGHFLYSPGTTDNYSNYMADFFCFCRHPDKHINDPDASERFMKINEAYEVQINNKTSCTTELLHTRNIYKTETIILDLVVAFIFQLTHVIAVTTDFIR